jgi:hypothetical protein
MLQKTTSKWNGMERGQQIEYFFRKHTKSIFEEIITHDLYEELKIIRKEILKLIRIHGFFNTLTKFMAF